MLNDMWRVAMVTRVCGSHLASACLSVFLPLDNIGRSVLVFAANIFYDVRRCPCAIVGPICQHGSLTLFLCLAYWQTCVHSDKQINKCTHGHMHLHWNANKETDIHTLQDTHAGICVQTCKHMCMPTRASHLSHRRAQKKRQWEKKRRMKKHKKEP